MNIEEGFALRGRNPDVLGGNQVPGMNVAIPSVVHMGPEGIAAGEKTIAAKG